MCVCTCANKMLLLSTIFCLFLSVNLTTAQLDPVETESPALVPCPPCDCTKPISCEERDVANPCNCCGRCHRKVGEVCGLDVGECAEDLLCLPDDPYSAEYSGKCYGEQCHVYSIDAHVLLSFRDYTLLDFWLLCKRRQV